MSLQNGCKDRGGEHPNPDVKPTRQRIVMRRWIAQDVAWEVFWFQHFHCWKRLLVSIVREKSADLFSGGFSDIFFWVLPPPPLKWRVVAYLSKKWDIFCSRLICHLWGQQRFISCLLDASVACRVVSHLLKIGSWACELGENTDHCGAPGLMSQRPWAELVIYFRECCTWGRNADPVVLLNVHMWRELTW